MEQDFYTEYSQIEDTHWWFRGRREIFTRILAPLADGKRRRILDIGFGTGAMLRFLSRYGTVVGMDMSADAIRFARSRCDSPMLLGDITQVPLESGSVDLVTAFDIIEHVDDDAAALRELARVCRPGGHMFITVPAFQFLWGNQDVISHHRRRYTLAAVERSVRAAGFEPRRLSYFNALLFPAVAAVRLARRLRGEPKGEIKSDFTMTKPGLVNDVLTRVFAAEGRMLTRFRLPVGVSVVCLAERRAA
jgi:ubiquinone/menaquinone biosynthesis C-methylase UbiE